jgi:hypothetical protein
LHKVPPQCSHVPMEIFLYCEIGKKWGNKKRVVCMRVGSQTCAFSWGLGTLWGSCPRMPLPPWGHTGTSLTTNIFLPSLSGYSSSHCRNNMSENNVRSVGAVLITDLILGGLGWDRSSGVIRANSFEGFSVFFYPRWWSAASANLFRNATHDEK